MKNPKSLEPALISRLSRRDFLRLAGASTVAVATGGLAACGSGETQGDGEGGAGEITFSTWILSEADEGAEQIRQSISTYEEQEDVDIGTNTYPYGEYLDQMVLQARGGNVSGVAHVDEAWLPTFATLGVLREVDSFMPENVYTEQARQIGMFKGTRYALPWTLGSIGLVGNTELLEQAGVSEMPRTIEEFEQTLESLKSLGTDFIPYAASTDLEQLKDIIPWMWTFGSDIISGDDVTLGDEGSVRAVEWWKSLLDKGYTAPDVTRADARTFFAQGRAAFYEDAPIAIRLIPQQSSDSDIANKMVPVPRPVEGSGDPQAIFWSQPLMVFKQGNTDAAEGFAQYMSTNEDVLRGFFKAVGNVPATEEGLQSSWYTDNEFYSTWSDELTQFARRNPFWSYAKSSQMERVLKENVQAAQLGNVSAQKAMERASEEIQSMIE